MSAILVDTNDLSNSAKNYLNSIDTHSRKGRQEILQVYLRLHNTLGNIRWLPLSLDFAHGRSIDLERYATGNYFMPQMIKKNLLQGPKCLEWGDRYTSSVLKDICTDRYQIKYQTAQCGGKFGRADDVFCADIHNTSGVIPDNMFDMVVCTQVFEHLKDPFTAIRNVYSIIKPGGALLFTVPQISIFHGVPDNYFFYSIQGVIQMLQDAGFCIQYAHGTTSSFVCQSNLMGLSPADIDLYHLNKTDDIAPCNIGAVALKPLNPGDECPKGDYPSVRELTAYRMQYTRRVAMEAGF